MLYKLLICVAILLCGTPLDIFAQEVVPIGVETIGDFPTPTTTRTGESFTQVYRISYIYSENWDRKIIITEDNMVPSVLSLGDGAELKVTDSRLSDPIITEGRESGTEEHSHYLYVTFRMINPTKDAYVIPRLKIRWAYQIGDEIISQDPIETEEVYFNYVTTVTQKPVIDIRDSTDFGDYSERVNLFWKVSRIWAPAGVLVSLSILVVSLRSVRRRRSEKSADKIVQEDKAKFIIKQKHVSFRRAYRDLLRAVNSLKALNSIPNKIGDINKVKNALNKIFVATDVVLRTQLKGFNPGDTATLDMEPYINKNIKPGNYKNALLFLQKGLADYQTAKQSNSITEGYTNIFIRDAEIFKGYVRLLRRHWRILAFLRKKA
jgi:hypothetical protein